MFRKEYKKMNKEFLEYRVCEADFGSSTSLAVKFENGKVVESIDISSYETNYVWDGGFEDNLGVGLSVQEMNDKMDNWFNGFEDEYRRPYVSKISMTEKDWTKIKLAQARKK